METIAQKHCRLAEESKAVIGYVLPEIARHADGDALSGHKKPGGYELGFADGSMLFMNAKTHDLTLL